MLLPRPSEALTRATGHTNHWPDDKDFKGINTTFGFTSDYRFFLIKMLVTADQKTVLCHYTRKAAGNEYILVKLSHRDYYYFF